MGYLLPIHSIQSQQYTDRMNMNPYNVSKVDRVEKVNVNDDLPHRDFSEGQNHSYLGDGNEKEGASVVSTPPSYEGFIYPNPANLSPDIARVLGKGLFFNQYI